MEIEKAAVAGTLESSDCMVTVEDGDGNIDLVLESTVMHQYGNQIRHVVLDTLESPGSGLQKHKRSIVAITAVIILLCGMVIVHGIALKKSNDAYKVQEEELQTQIDAEKERSEEINKLKKYVGTDEYIEEVAREKLGLVKENEILFRAQQ